MRFEAFSFGSIRINGVTYEHDVLIDRGEVHKRKKKPSKKFRADFGHTPVSVEEKIPWKCRRLAHHGSLRPARCISALERHRPADHSAISAYGALTHRDAILL